MAFWNRRRDKHEQETEEIKEGAADAAVTAEGAPAKQVRQRQDAPVPPAKESPAERKIAPPIHEEDKKRYVTECCQAVRETELQIDETRIEYQKVTDALLDIQKIDRATGESKKNLLQAAGNIVRLTGERNRYKNRNLTISDAVMRRFEPYENELVDEIKKMYAEESYQGAIESDLEKLTEEKESLRIQEKEIIEKQDALKGMAKVLLALIFALFVLFASVYFAMDLDMTLPYLATILLAAVSATFLFVEANRNRRQMTLAGRKKEKAVSLLNSVKIKYVNNKNLLDYSRAKFGVADAAEFERLWTEYMRAREYERKFRENTEQLNYYCDSLLEMLEQLGVSDCEIWLSQAPALADDREMVEIRHVLNTKRQALREQIEQIETQKNGYLNDIDRVIQETAEGKEALLGIVERYSVE